MTTHRPDTIASGAPAMNDTIARTQVDRREVADPAGDDAAAVARRAAAFARELGAVGEVGRLLAKRAAVVAGRMEQLAERDRAMTEVNVQAARDAFDADRRAESARWAAALDGDDLGRVADGLANLELSPEGLDTLRRAWGRILDGVRSGDPAEVAGASTRARKYLGAAGVPAPADAAGLAAAVMAEAARLRGRDERLRPAMDGLIADARRDVGLAAAFDPSPEAAQARRHEAAAERALYRAIKMIRDLRRDAGLADVAEAEARAPLPEPAPRPAERPARPACPPIALGSFRLGDESPPTSPAPTPLASFRVGTGNDDRRRRPDLAKVGKKRR